MTHLVHEMRKEMNLVFLHGTKLQKDFKRYRGINISRYQMLVAVGE